jgi:tetratricopeptide (TPR) repeat protein
MTERFSTVSSDFQPDRGWLQRLVPILVLLFTAFIYARTVTSSFVFDDTSFIVSNPFVQSPANIPRYFTEPVWSGIGIAQKNYYRPVFLLWVLGNYTAFGPHPAGWHLTSLLLHLVNTFLVYLLAMRLLRVPLAAGVAAALFGLHPIQAEAVSWICCANDLLACLFSLASLLSYLKACEASPEARLQRVSWAGVSLLFYAAGAFSKEPAVALPLILLVHGWSGGPAFRPAGKVSAGSPRAHLKSLIPYVAMVLVYFLLRRHALGSLLGNVSSVITRRGEILTLPTVLLTYLGHFFWPVNLSAFYDISYQESLSWTGVLLPGLLLLIPGAFCIWAAWRSSAARMALAWTGFFLLPALHIAAFPRGEFVHDRFFYLPMAGISLLAGIGFRAARDFLGRAEEARFRGVSTLSWASGVVLISLALITWRQTGFWSNNYELFRRGVEIAPQNGVATGNLGIEYMKAGDRATASMLLRRADTLNPDLWEADKVQGLEHFQNGRFREAEQAFDVAVATRPEDPFSHLMLGLLCLKTGRSAEAVVEGRKAVALAPRDGGFHFGLANILEETGNLTAARDEYRAELAIRPDHQPSLQKLQELDRRLGPATTR